MACRFREQKTTTGTKSYMESLHEGSGISHFVDHGKRQGEIYLAAEIVDDEAALRTEPRLHPVPDPCLRDAPP